MINGQEIRERNLKQILLKYNIIEDGTDQKDYFEERNEYVEHKGVEGSYLQIYRKSQGMISNEQQQQSQLTDDTLFKRLSIFDERLQQPWVEQHEEDQTNLKDNESSNNLYNQDMDINSYFEKDGKKAITAIKSRRKSRVSFYSSAKKMRRRSSKKIDRLSQDNLFVGTPNVKRMTRKTECFGKVGEYDNLRTDFMRSMTADEIDLQKRVNKITRRYSQTPSKQQFENKGDGHHQQKEFDILKSWQKTKGFQYLHEKIESGCLKHSKELEEANVMILKELYKGPFSKKNNVENKLKEIGESMSLSLTNCHLSIGILQTNSYPFKIFQTEKQEEFIQKKSASIKTPAVAVRNQRNLIPGKKQFQSQIVSSQKKSKKILLLY